MADFFDLTPRQASTIKFIAACLGANSATNIGLIFELFDADLPSRYLKRVVVIDIAKEIVGTPNWKKESAVLKSHDRFGADVAVRVIEIQCSDLVALTGYVYCVDNITVGKNEMSGMRWVFSV